MGLVEVGRVRFVHRKAYMKLVEVSFYHLKACKMLVEVGRVPLSTSNGIGGLMKFKESVLSDVKCVGGL